MVKGWTPTALSAFQTLHAIKRSNQLFGSHSIDEKLTRAPSFYERYHMDRKIPSRLERRIYHSIY
ncbi:hypothetical protein PLUTE_b0628 [Pseudoalteromonas luteoviolacea DSM 6061]|nr:hypothetical protein [Pseudoalteromonas luteoviolacea DSM 6061]